MSDLLGDIVEAICGEAIGNVVDRFVDSAPTWLLGLIFLAAAGLTVFLFAAVHWGLGVVGTVASVCLAALWVMKFRFG